MQRRLLLTATLAAALCAPAAQTLAGPEVPFPLLSRRAPAERPAIMVVGVAHFDNPSRDVVNTKVDDVLTPKRQKEIAAIVDQLATFHPTHVAVEWAATRQDKLDARYAAYRAGTYTLSRDELDQLGLRLAAKLGLPRVDAVDWQDEPPGKDEDYDFTAYPNTPDAKARYAALSDPKRGERDSAKLRGMTLGAYLRDLNDPASLANDNAIYFDFAMLGDDQKAPGANWVGSWHMRNLRIFAKLVRVADKPSDRVLVIYGAGHGFLLNEFAQQSHAFKVVSPEPLLAAAANRLGRRLLLRRQADAGLGHFVGDLVGRAVLGLGAVEHLGRVSIRRASFISTQAGSKASPRSSARISPATLMMPPPLIT